ncbi:hypothetical protein L6M95_27880, partial [Klebsiella pneumoniae]|nr:hypothetical protein [Klebsiella pneumoniae]MCL3776431.1 hypothetical protein [Klebsiella pneumoniae]
NDVTLKMPAFEWVHVQLHQQKGMISLSPPTICNSAEKVMALAGSEMKRLYAVGSENGGDGDAFVREEREAMDVVLQALDGEHMS